MKHNLTKDSLIIGFAMFAIFFGAGNLIFPPQIGLASGSGVVWGILGMTLTGIFLPMLAVAAIGNVGGTLKELTQHVNPWWHILYMALCVFLILFGTIPRCGSVAFESGLQGIFPDIPAYGKWIFLIIFFGISYYFASNKSSLINRIGQYLTPLLLIMLLVIVLLAVFHPIGKVEGGTAANPFTNAMLTAYNTGDIATGLICAGIFIESIRKKGYTEAAEFKRILFRVILVAFLILVIVYGGLCYLGAQGTRLFPADIDQTTFLVGLVQKLAGYGGIVSLSTAIILACLTTAAGMIGTGADWIVQGSRDRLPYKPVALVMTLIILLTASTGIGVVLKISGPVFTFIFPMSVVMTLLGVFNRYVPNSGAWKGAVYTATVFSLYDAFAAARSNGLVSLQTAGLDRLIGTVPLAADGFAWLIPTVVGYAIGAVLWKRRAAVRE